MVDKIAVQEKPITFSLDGEWGTGKTYLLNRLVAEYEMKGGQAVYFSSWEDDDLDNPFILLVHHILSQLKEEHQQNEFKKYASVLLKSVVKKTAKVALNLVLTETKIGSSVKKVFDSIKEEVQNIQNEIEADDINKLLLDYEEQTTAKSAFRKKLTEIANQIKKETNKPLLIIIDELDRCKPTFAIEMLERVKHLFGVSNIVFLFGVNRRELSNSIKSVYGEIDANNYLHRFIDYNIRIEVDTAKRKNFLDKLLEHYAFEEKVQGLVNPNLDGKKRCLVLDPENIKRYLLLMMNNCEFSLREMQVAFRLFIAAVRRWTTLNPLYESIIPLIIILKVKYPERAEDFLCLNTNAAEIIDLVFPTVKGDERDLIGRAVAIISYVYMMAGKDKDQTDVLRQLFDTASPTKENEELRMAIYQSKFVARCIKENSNLHQMFHYAQFMVSHVNDWKVVRSIANSLSLND